MFTKVFPQVRKSFSVEMSTTFSTGHTVDSEEEVIDTRRCSSFFGWFDVEDKHSRDSISRTMSPSLHRIFSYVDSKAKTSIFDHEIPPDSNVIDQCKIVGDCPMCEKKKKTRNLRVIRGGRLDVKDMHITVREDPSVACATIGYRVVRVRGYLFLPYDFPEFQFSISVGETLYTAWRSIYDFERLFQRLNHLHLPQSRRVWAEIRETRGTYGAFPCLSPHFLMYCSRLYDVLMGTLMQELKELSFLVKFLIVPEWACKSHKKKVYVS